MLLSSSLMPGLVLTPLFFFFFCTIPPPPISTLFPYTTLFRSVRRGVQRLLQGRDPQPPERDRALRWREHGPDRKSTRLNSSHRCISYAVFCLKKKKKQSQKGSRAAPPKTTETPERTSLMVRE